MGSVYAREQGSLDGFITNVIAGQLGNANTSYTYVDYLRDGYKHLSLAHYITATTLTIEMCNLGVDDYHGRIQTGVATASDGTGATLTDVGLAANFPADTDLNQIFIRIIQDDTTPSNVGLVREVVGHVGATGVLTLSSAIGAVTSGVTKYRLEDNPNKWGRCVSDPTSAQWTDVTSILTGAASHTASGVWFFDTDIVIERFRVKRVTTNATNALLLGLSRGR
jgi:hypothetical protein